MSKHPRFYQSLKTALSRINSQSSEPSDCISLSLADQKPLIGVVEVEESAKEDFEEDPQWEVDKLFQAMRDAIVITDPQGRYLRANAAAIILFGATPEELLGKSLGDFLAPEVDFSLEWQTWQAQGWISGETKLRRLDGTELFVDYSATKNFLPGFDLFMFQDITERKRSAAALLASERKYRAISEQATEGIYWYDADTSLVVEANSTFCTMIGYTPAEIPQLRISQFVVDQQEKIRQNLQNILTTKSYFLSNCNYRRRDGSLFIVEVNATLVLEENRRLICCAVRDPQNLHQQNPWYAVLENMPMMMNALDNNYNFIAWNKECERVTGYSAAEIINNPEAIELLYPDPQYRQNMFDDWREMGNNFRDWRLDLTCKNGTVKTLDWSSLSVQFPVEGWSTWAVGLDVTTYKHSATMLSESQRRFHSLMENLPCAVYRCDHHPPETMWFMSNYIEEISGYPASDFLQDRERTFMSIIHPEDQPGAAVRLIGKTVTSYNNEYRIITADAQIKWVQEQGNGVFDEQGNLFALEGVIYDITDRREMELALGSSLDRFSLIAQSAFDGIWDMALPPQAFQDLADPSYRHLMVYYSPRFRQSLGYSDQEFPNILNSWFSRVHPEDLERLLQGIQDHLYSKKSLQNIEYRLLTQQGEYRWYRAAGQAIWNEQEQPIRMAGSMRDITERKQIEREVQLQHHRDQLMAAIAQRIRQSLDLEKILETTATEIKQFLEVEWVAIYQLSTACQGKCGAAITANPAYFPCHECMAVCLAPQLPGGASPLENPSSEIPSLATVQSLLAGSNVDLVIPISILDSHPVHQSQPALGLDQANLPQEEHTQFWGLICCHYSQKLDLVEPWRVEFLQRLALQLAIAIQQSQLYARIKQANHELARLAAIDGLTQVWNRRYFDECLDREWWRCRREQQYLSLILCDVDYFKAYNDTYGHPAGDQVLRQISQAMSQTLRRSTDLVARYGGEEFGLILPDTDTQGAEIVAHQIRTAIYNLQIPHRSSPLGYVTISLGVATVMPRVDRYVIDLMKTTDQALYTAKAQGRNRAFIVN